MALTELEIKKARSTEKPQKLSDGGGLYLLVQVNGGKYWRLAYRFAGKQKTLALGIYPAVSLTDAREGREKARKLLLKDTDPNAIRQAAKLEDRKAAQVAENSFAVLAMEYHTLKAPMWTAQHAKQWLGNMEKY